jgi:porin
MRGLALSLVLPLLLAAPVWAQDPPSPNAGPQDVSFFDSFFDRPYLLGDWGGERTSLAEKGITFDFFYIADLEANPTGGLQQTQAGWPRIRGTMDIDFDKLITWQGLSFRVTGLWQSGVNLGAKIGTLANPSDLVSQHTTRLDSFWLEQRLFHNKVRIRAGQMAGLDFYGDQDMGGSWLIEPLGYAFGNLFNSIFESFNPAGTPGAEIRFSPTPKFYVKSAVMAGNRNPYQEDTSGFGFAIRDTPNFLFEAGYVVHPTEGNAALATFGEDYGAKTSPSATKKSYPGIYKFGGIYNGGKFPDPAGHKSKGNYLIYGGASQALFRTKAGSNRGLDATFSFDWSPGDVSRENSQITAGARFNAPFASRGNDRIDLGFVYTKISDPFANFGALLGEPLLRSEKAFEVNYAFQVTRFFLLEPTFQYYLDVGGNRILPNAVVLGFRTKVNF